MELISEIMNWRYEIILIGLGGSFGLLLSVLWGYIVSKQTKKISNEEINNRLSANLEEDVNKINSYLKGLGTRIEEISKSRDLLLKKIEMKINEAYTKIDAEGKYKITLEQALQIIKESKEDLDEIDGLDYEIKKVSKSIPKRIKL